MAFLNNTSPVPSILRHKISALTPNLLAIRQIALADQSLTQGYRTSGAS